MMIRYRYFWVFPEEPVGILTCKQRNLKRMLPRKIIALLNPDEDKPQFTRSTTFIDGLNQAGDIFSRRFRVTKQGLKRAHWAEDQEQLKQRMVRLVDSKFCGIGDGI